MIDLNGKNAEDLLSKKLFLFDMDGTIYKENILFDKVKELLYLIKKNNGKYIFITNNSSKSVNDYINKLKNFNIETNEDNFFTSTQATAIYLKEKYNNKKIFCLGTKSFLEELNSFKINTTEKNDFDIAAVVVGFDTELTYNKLILASELLSKGLPFIATNPDKACPVSFGFIPDCGAICETLYFSTNRRPIYIGKPNPEIILFLMNKFNYKKDETVVIGDRLYTDIASGINAGVTTICVLTGETKEEDLKKTKYVPSFVFNDLSELYSILSRKKQ